MVSSALVISGEWYLIGDGIPSVIFITYSLVFSHLLGVFINQSLANTIGMLTKVGRVG